MSFLSSIFAHFFEIDFHLWATKQKKPELSWLLIHTLCYSLTEIKYLYKGHMFFVYEYYKSYQYRTRISAWFNQRKIQHIGFHCFIRIRKPSPLPFIQSIVINPCSILVSWVSRKRQRINSYFSSRPQNLLIHPKKEILNCFRLYRCPNLLSYSNRSGRLQFLTKTSYLKSREIPPDFFYN